MKFIDNEHKNFWEDKLEIMQMYGKTDVYYKSLVYILGISQITRENFDRIFDLKNGEINIDSLKDGWQTESSLKVTRMAFNLWNNCNYDSMEDAYNGNISIYYNPSDIFCTSYAPYFYEGIKLRYPEYTKEKIYEFEME